jgi:hypothetical protein
MTSTLMSWVMMKLRLATKATLAGAKRSLQ